MRSLFTLRNLPLAVFSLTVGVSATSAGLPVVDLGYTKHQALSYNETTDAYSFLNIRYAAPPVGELRWAAPQAPTANASAIDDGSVDRKCPSHKPNWFSLAPQTIVPLFTGRGDAINSTALQSQLDAMNAQTTQEDSRNATIGSNPENSETEDCLFLDVYSPKDAFEEVGSTYGRPVLVYIHSGGYIWGSKHDFTTAGLFQRAASTGPPMVMVALNYRLGALGFLSGPTIQKDGLANAGLHDQRFALEWIQKNIHLFGGDRNKVTVWGGSAGAGSIMQQITAYGGRGDALPFQQAILESPGLTQTTSPIVEEQQVQTFMSWFNATTLQEARKASSAEVIRANYLGIAVAAYGSFGYGPSVDGDFVPASPSTLFRNGRFDKSIRLLHMHAANEGYGLASPAVTNDAAFEQFVLEAFPGLGSSPETLKYVVSELYPSVFDDSQALGYKSQYERAAVFLAEAFYTCSIAYIGDALPFNTWSSDFVITPSLHESGATHTLFNGPYTNVSRIASNTTALSTEQIAYVYQGYISRFAQFGNPDGDDTPYWPVYGKNTTAQIVNTSGFTTGKSHLLTILASGGARRCTAKFLGPML